MPDVEAESREARIVAAFVDLADSLVTDFDVVELFHRLLDHGLPLIGAEAGGLLLHHEGRLRVVASTSEDMQTLELFELQNTEGPCYDAYIIGRTITVDDLSAAHERWPQFAPRAIGFGWASVHAVPLRLRDETIGALNVFATARRTLTELEAKLIRGLADVATIAVLQQRAVASAHETAGQLEIALDSRVVIEQAKGRISERVGCGADEAFQHLRSYARSRGRRLSDTARAVVDGTLPIDEVMA